jgi:hypothetical protein
MAQNFNNLLSMGENFADAAGAQFAKSPYYRGNFNTLGAAVPGWQTYSQPSYAAKVLGRNDNGRHPFELIAAKGWDPADPQTYIKVRNALLGSKGKSFSPQYYVRANGGINNYMRNAPAPMRDAYAKSRYSYDNGLRSGYGDELSNYNGRGQAEAWDVVTGADKPGYYKSPYGVGEP